MQQTLPKQFLPLGNKPILAHTITNLLKCPLFSELILVLPAAFIDHPIVKECLPKTTFPVKLVAGGRERQDSVYLALQELDPAAELVLIHDGVRPFVTADQITQLLSRCQEYAGAILAIPIFDTVKEVERGLILSTKERQNLYLAQTPQVFRREIIVAAYTRAIADRFVGTDDAMLVERLGHKVAIVSGERRNLKITCQSDLELAKFLLHSEADAV